MDNALLDELIKCCDSLRIPVAELQGALDASKLDVPAFCDAFSSRVAHRFLAGSLDYWAADAAVNNLWAFAFKPPGQEPGPYALSIYQAFDSGEYSHPGDDPSVDPVERYARPELARIISGESGRES